MFWPSPFELVPYENIHKVISKHQKTDGRMTYFVVNCFPSIFDFFIKIIPIHPELFQKYSGIKKSQFQGINTHRSFVSFYLSFIPTPQIYLSIFISLILASSWYKTG